MNINESLLNKLKSFRALNEAKDDDFSFERDDFDDPEDGFDYSDFGENDVKQGSHFDADGEEYIWDKPFGSVHQMDFDRWQVWSAINQDTDEEAYFVVDIDTGFIDWGPVETVDEATSFLESKQEDYDMDEDFKEACDLTERVVLEKDGYTLVENKNRKYDKFVLKEGNEIIRTYSSLKEAKEDLEKPEEEDKEKSVIETEPVEKEDITEEPEVKEDTESSDDAQGRIDTLLKRKKTEALYSSNSSDDTYGYEIWFDGNCISEDNFGYDDYDEASESAMGEVIYIIENEEGYEDNSIDDFEIRVIEPDVTEFCKKRITESSSRDTNKKQYQMNSEDASEETSSEDNLAESRGVDGLDRFYYKANDKTYVFECNSRKTRNGFAHDCWMSVAGEQVAFAKCFYYNRTWEMFEYQTVMLKAVDKASIDKEDKEILKGKINKSQYDKESWNIDEKEFESVEESLTEGNHDNKGFFITGKSSKPNYGFGKDTVNGLLILARDMDGAVAEARKRFGIEEPSVNETPISDWNKVVDYCKANLIEIVKADDDGSYYNKTHQDENLNEKSSEKKDDEDIYDPSKEADASNAGSALGGAIGTGIGLTAGIGIPVIDDIALGAAGSLLGSVGGKHIYRNQARKAAKKAEVNDEKEENTSSKNESLNEEATITITGINAIPEQGMNVAPVLENPIAPMPENNQLGNVVDEAKKVMEAYQNANKWMDILKEFLFSDLGCPFFASYIHNLAHTMPVRFDKFGDILHTIDMKIPYPATQYIPQEPQNIDDVFNMTFMILDAIKTALNDFIKCADDNYHGMACAAETLLNDIEAEYVPLYKMKKAWTAYQEPMRFDRWVGTYAEKRADLNESLDKEATGHDSGDLLDKVSYDDLSDADKKFIQMLKISKLTQDQYIDKLKNINMQAQLTGRCPTCGGELNHMCCRHCGREYTATGNQSGMGFEGSSIYELDNSGKRVRDLSKLDTEAVDESLTEAAEKRLMERNLPDYTQRYPEGDSYDSIYGDGYSNSDDYDSQQDASYLDSINTNNKDKVKTYAVWKVTGRCYNFPHYEGPLFKGSKDECEKWLSDIGYEPLPFPTELDYEIMQESLTEALMHPELRGKEVEFTVNNAFSNFIDRLFGNRIQDKTVLDKNQIKYVIPYDSDIEQLGTRNAKIKKAIQALLNSQDEIQSEESKNESLNEGTEVDTKNIELSSIINWLSEHKQAWKDALNHFGVNIDPKEYDTAQEVFDIEYETLEDSVTKEELIDWISDHKNLYNDFNKYYSKMNDFSLPVDEESKYDSDEEFGGEPIYQATGYLGSDYRGVMDSFDTNDFSELKDWIWEKLNDGNYIEVIKKDHTPIRIDPDQMEDIVDDPSEWLNDVLDYNDFKDESLNEIFPDRLNFFVRKAKKEFPELINKYQMELNNSTSKGEDFYILNLFWSEFLDTAMEKWNYNDEFFFDGNATMPMPESVAKQFVNQIFNLKNLNVLTDLDVDTGFNDSDEYDGVDKEEVVNWYNDNAFNNDTEEFEESLNEDTKKKGNKWVNQGEDGTHGEFDTKEEADDQRKAMFANGYKGESIDEAKKSKLDKQAELERKRNGTEDEYNKSQRGAMMPRPTVFQDKRRQNKYPQKFDEN